MCSSSPAPAPTSTSQTTSNIPDWAIPSATKNLGKAEALTDINQNPYQQYQGQRVAGFNPLQTQAMGSIQNMQASPAIGAGMGIAGAAGMGSLNAGGNYNRMATDPYAMQAFMSPYQQNVTDFQKSRAIDDYSRQLPGMGAAASKAGAFGGSRQAIVESEGQRNLQDTLAGIQATGSQNAFQQAQQAQQFGANLGLQGYGQANQVAQGLGALGMQNYQQNMGIAQAQQQAGAQVQAQEQQGLSNQYQDFLNQQNYPYKQLGFMSDIIRGTPTSGGAQSMYQAPPSGISQFAGLAGGLGSLYGGYNQAMKAAGGEIKGYAEGGAVAFGNGGGVVPLPSAAEFMVAKKANERPDKNDTSGLGALLKAAGMGADLQNLIVAQKQVKTKQQEDTIRDLQNRLAQATGMPEQQSTTVKEDVSNMLQREVESRQGGIVDLDTGRLYPQRDTDNLAGGGIVAFDDGGDVRHFQTAGAVTAEPNMVESRGLALDAARDALNANKAEALKANRALGLLGRRNQPGIFAEYTNRQAELQNAVNKAQAEYVEALGPVPGGMAKSVFQPISTLGATNTPASVPAPAAKLESGDGPTQISLGGLRDREAPAPSTSPLAPRPSSYAAPSGAPAVDSADSDHTKLMATLQGNADEGEALLKKSIRTPETLKTAEEYAALSREQENAFLKARNLPTVEESMKERLDNLATAGREARNNRDVDRWMAVAQGFFAMAGGKSQYAMQNMADGLNIGVKELRAVEQDYRKIDQLQKDKAELLKEATRQEARGDFAKGQTLRKEAEDRRDKIEASNLVVAERLLHYSGDAMGRAIAAKSANDARKEATLLRTQQAGIAAQDRKYRFDIDQQNRTDRFNKAREDRRDKLELEYRKTDVDYKSQVALSNQLSTMGLREDLKPEQQKIYDGLVTKYNNVGTAIDTRARTFANKRIKDDAAVETMAENIISGKK